MQVSSLGVSGQGHVIIVGFTVMLLENRKDAQQIRHAVFLVGDVVRSNAAWKPMIGDARLAVPNTLARFFVYSRTDDPHGNRRGKFFQSILVRRIDYET